MTNKVKSQVFILRNSLKEDKGEGVRRVTEILHTTILGNNMNTHLQDSGFAPTEEYNNIKTGSVLGHVKPLCSKEKQKKQKRSGGSGHTNFNYVKTSIPKQYLSHIYSVKMC